MTAMPAIFTIGHSDHSIERFIRLLVSHDISAIADVRSTPYSKFSPWFNREQLGEALEAPGIRYVFLGSELGARRSEPECYEGDKARYELIARAPLFRAGLDRLREGWDSHRVALMCSEKDPITCHRAILICRHLRPFGIRMTHILEDGSTESHEAMEGRLLRLVGLDEPELFYDLQADRIAYVKSGLMAGAVR